MTTPEYHVEEREGKPITQDELNALAATGLKLITSHAHTVMDRTPIGMGHSLDKWTPTFTYFFERLTADSDGPVVREYRQLSKIHRRCRSSSRR